MTSHARVTAIRWRARKIPLCLQDVSCQDIGISRATSAKVPSCPCPPRPSLPVPPAPLRGAAAAGGAARRWGPQGRRLPGTEAGGLGFRASERRAGEGRCGHGGRLSLRLPQIRARRKVFGLLAFLPAVLNETVGAIPADGCNGATQSPPLATVAAAATAPRRQCNSCNSSPPTVKPVERSRVIPSETFRTIPSQTF